MRKKNRGVVPETQMGERCAEISAQIIRVLAVLCPRGEDGQPCSSPLDYYVVQGRVKESLRSAHLLWEQETGTVRQRYEALLGAYKHMAFGALGYARGPLLADRRAEVEDLFAAIPRGSTMPDSIVQKTRAVFSTYRAKIDALYGSVERWQGNALTFDAGQLVSAYEELCTDLDLIEAALELWVAQEKQRIAAAQRAQQHAQEQAAELARQEKLRRRAEHGAELMKFLR